MKSDDCELFLNQINNLANRRQMVTTTYLSVNTVLVGAMAFLFKDGQFPGPASQITALALLLSGLVVCGLWRKLILQHSVLISWWYSQLRAWETNVPEDKRIFTKEYEELYLGKKEKALVGLTRYETQLTWLFMVIYLVFGLAIVVMLFISLIR